jgi:hypothetical protein
VAQVVGEPHHAGRQRDTVQRGHDWLGGRVHLVGVTARQFGRGAAGSDPASAPGEVEGRPDRRPRQPRLDGRRVVDLMESTKGAGEALGDRVFGLVRPAGGADRGKGARPDAPVQLAGSARVTAGRKHGEHRRGRLVGAGSL